VEALRVNFQTGSLEEWSFHAGAGLAVVEGNHSQDVGRVAVARRAISSHLAEAAHVAAKLRMLGSKQKHSAQQNSNPSISSFLRSISIYRRKIQPLRRRKKKIVIGAESYGES
jgi:hypothetical protein